MLTASFLQNSAGHSPDHSTDQRADWPAGTPGGTRCWVRSRRCKPPFKPTVPRPATYTGGQQWRHRPCGCHGGITARQPPAIIIPCATITGMVSGGGSICFRRFNRCECPQVSGRDTRLTALRWTTAAGPSRATPRSFFTVSPVEHNGLFMSPRGRTPHSCPVDRKRQCNGERGHTGPL